MTQPTRTGRIGRGLLLAAACALAAAGCTPITFINGSPSAHWPWPLPSLPIAFWNNTTTLGSDFTGSRGRINVSFVNNTSYRAIFTFGSYDPQNTTIEVTLGSDSQFFTPQFAQFYASEDEDLRLDPFSDSGIIQFTCARGFAVGGQQMVDLIKDLELETTRFGDEVEEEALEPVSGLVPFFHRAGIAFSDLPIDDPDANTDNAGWAPGRVDLQGTFYGCGSLLIYTFEEDALQPGGIRVDLEVVTPE